MKTFLTITNKTTVKRVSKFLLGFAFLFSPAQMASANQIGTFSTLGVEDQERLDSSRSCKDLQNQIFETEKAMNEACGKAGYKTADNCAVKFASCKETAQEESYNTTEALATALGVQLSDPSSKKNNTSCPTLNAKDYKTTKDDLNKRLKEAQKDLAKLSEDQAKNQKEYDETIAELMQAMSDANEALTESKSKLDEEQRNKISEFQNAQKEVARSIRDNESKLIKLRSDLTAALREKTYNLSQLTAEGTKFSCTAQYNKVIKENSANSSGTGSYLSRSKSIKGAAIDAFNKCMDQADTARIQVNDKYKTASESLNKEIANVEADNADLNDNIKVASSQLSEIKTDILNRKTAAEKKVSDLLTKTQSQMESAQRELQTKLASIQKQQQDLNREINSISNELTNLVAPVSGSEISIYEANSQIGAKSAQIDSLLERCEQSCSNKCSSTINQSYKNSVQESGSKKSGNNSRGNGTTKKTGGTQ